MLSVLMNGRFKFVILKYCIYDQTFIVATLNFLKRYSVHYDSSTSILKRALLLGKTNHMVYSYRLNVRQYFSLFDIDVPDRNRSFERKEKPVKRS